MKFLIFKVILFIKEFRRLLCASKLRSRRAFPAAFPIFNWIWILLIEVVAYIRLVRLGSERVRRFLQQITSIACCVYKNSARRFAACHMFTQLF